MIAHFPDPYRGELFYSLCARFAERMQYPTLSATMLELFGDRSAVTAIELPNQIDSLLSRLPPGHSYTADMLIDKHTLFPLYGAFIREENYHKLRQLMKGSGIRTTQLVSGINACRVPPPPTLRCCTLCDEENVQKFGETYWHRVHQVPGVEVCPFHPVFLTETNASRGKQETRHNFVSAKNAERVSISAKLDLSNQSHVVLLKVAQLAAEILEIPPRVEFRQNLKNRYRAALRRKGYTERLGRLRVIEAKRDIAKFCPEETLSRLNCGLPKSNAYSGWLGALLHSKQQSIAPIRHLLFMAWLDQPLNSFLNQEPVADPLLFTFPCLNSVCEHFGKLVNNRVEFRASKRVSVLKVFRCPHCSHASSRTEATTEIVRVIDFGHSWAEKLRLLWDDEQMSLAQIAERLGADPTTVRRRAAAMGLKFPRFFQSARPVVSPKKFNRTPAQAERQAKREKWLALANRGNLKANQKLKRLHTRLYSWLRKYDPSWLAENSLRGNRQVPQKELVDWPKRDKELAARVPNAVASIKARVLNPRRISLTRIGRELGTLTTIQMHKDKLPKTIKAIREAEETREQFGLRRLENAVAHFLATRVAPNWSELTKKAGINSNLYRSPLIAKAVRSALLETELGLLNEVSKNFAV